MHLAASVTEHVFLPVMLRKNFRLGTSPSPLAETRYVIVQLQRDDSLRLIGDAIKSPVEKVLISSYFSFPCSSFLLYIELGRSCFQQLAW